jgi:hypothetical protein
MRAKGPNSDPLTIARRYGAMGFSLIPVPRPVHGTPPGSPGDGKVPTIKWRPYQDRLPTDAELVAWFGGAPKNLAIVTGRISDCVVVDADSPAGLTWCTRTLAYTPWQVQTRRGFHLYYRHPGVRVTNRSKLETRDGTIDVDLRADGGYVIAAGSVHATGSQYVEAGDWTVPRDQVPRFWPGWLRRPTRPSTPRPILPRPTGDVIERARRYLAAIPRPEIGAGSDRSTLYAAARLVRGFNLSPTEAEALLWEWAGNRPGWTREWIAHKVDHAVRYGSEPVGALQ